MKQILKIFIALVFLLVASVSVAYARDGVSILALDTIANFDTMVKVSGLAPNGSLSISVTKPEGGVFKKDSFADTNGKAGVSIPSSETRTAGIYTVSMAGQTITATFRVFPADVSAEKSGVYVGKTAVSADGVDYSKISVRATDEFGNPLEYHQIKLVSSRSSDRISKDMVETDSGGLASFFVSSQYPGISTLTATDNTKQITFSKRVSVTFVRAPLNASKSIGGDPETVLLAQAASNVAKFEIENIAATVNLNETASFRVSAVDASGAVVSGYTGKILFSSTDPNAQLPTAYTFLVADQGRKTFELALTLRTPGSQKLIVQQEGNALIKGEKTIEVVAQQNAGNSPVRLTKPATGTYRVNTLEIAGDATPNLKVKIFDNGQQITEVQSNSAGRFSYNTSLLTDGQHTFHAESNGIQSTPVTITIDSTPAQVEQIEIVKSALAPGETTPITIKSDTDLNSIQATVGEFITDLKPDPQNPGYYVGTLTAPAQAGEYTVNVILTDKIGNVSPAVEAGKIRVDTSLQMDSSTSFSVPSKVRGVVATPGNGRVTLVWQAAMAEAGIAQYRIYYGTDAQNPGIVINTKDAGTSWYVPNLTNGATYYFRVVGIDTQGNEGDNLSDTVSAAPSASAAGASVIGTGDLFALCDPGPCPEAGYPPAQPQDGPEVLGMVIASLLAGSAIKIFRRKKGA